MKESSVGEDHRNVSCSRGIYRSRLSPHSLTPGEKLNVREGITTSADQPSDDLATLASQIPSQSSETLSGPEISPSARAPAALIWKKYPVRRSPEVSSTMLTESSPFISP